MPKPSVYDVAIKTPLELLPRLSHELDCAVYAKREDLQSVKSFKIRGAYNKIVHLSAAEKAKGVLAASAGNHAQGVALSAQRLGIQAHIVMPTTTPDVKVEAVKQYGAKVTLHGNNYSEAADYCANLVKKSGMTYIHPFDDPLVIAGQGTVATELLEQLPDVTHIFVPVGGGGLLAGVLNVVKNSNRDIHVIGVEPQDSDVMRQSITMNKRVKLSHVGIFADGVAVAQVGKNTLEAARQVDAMVTVSDDTLCMALAAFVEQTHSALETAGALALAGVRVYADEYGLKSTDKAVVICSGANIDNVRLLHVLRRAELANERNALYRITLPEQPGALLTLCKQVINGHNITQFEYRKNSSQVNAHILIGIRVSDAQDKQRLQAELTYNGYTFSDLSQDKLIREHGAAIGGDMPNRRVEAFYSVEFADRPGALLDLLAAIGDTWNISLFQYGGSAGDTGRVLIGFEHAIRARLEPLLKRHTNTFARADASVALMYE
jgi:threonine dehydratase